MSLRSIPAAVVLTVAAVAPLAFAADTETIRAQAGRTYVGSIASGTDSHVIQLDDFVLGGMTITISLKADKSDLEPDLALESPSAVDMTPDLVPYRKDGATSVSVKKFPSPVAEGRYLLRVKSKNSTTGAYKLKITTKPVRSFKGIGAVPGVAGSHQFEVPAPTDASVRLKVSATSPGSLEPVYESIIRDDCLLATLVPGTRVGQAGFVAPWTGTHTVTVGGSGVTQGPFKWSAKVKPAKAPKTPVRVDGAPAYYPEPGPLPAKAVVTTGSAIRGIETDGVELSWREVRTNGGGPNLNKNSVEIARVTGSSRRNLANNFATDANVVARNFSMGLVNTAVVAEDELFLVPRDGSGEVSLDTTLANPIRILVGDEGVYMVMPGGIRQYFLDGSGSTDFTTAAGTIEDACLAGQGIVYTVLQGGDVEVHAVDPDGGNGMLLGTVASQGSATALAGRGRDVFVAVNDGSDNTAVWRIDGCGVEDPVSIYTSTGGLLMSMAVDDANVYVMQDDLFDLGLVVQVPRGGGVHQVLARHNFSGIFSIDLADVGAAGGYVYFSADASGTESIYRVKRTK